ncbi:MAG: flagellar filament capping protein FliD [Acidobacteria bacterium]|nr:flagellar filament capping protein FliD [Acidobacteriota bacterium]
MSSPITFSGANGIDFNQILSIIMTQESQPLVALQNRQAALQSKAATFGTLASRALAVQQAAAKLADTSQLSGYAATSSNSSALAVSATSSAIPGRYDVVVNELAKAQVTASTTAAPDPDTVVSNGGTITIGGVTVTLAGSTTLRQLADAINATGNPPARASVVQSGPSSYRLVLSAKDTGQANAFTITNNLTGGSGLAFGDADSNGVSGDSAADNAVQASDASLLVNNIPITSTTNTITSAVPGVTITAFQRDPARSITVDVAADTASVKTKLQDFVKAYNDFQKFVTDQGASALKGDIASIGRDPLLRQIKDQMRSVLVNQYGTGGVFSALSQVGLEFTRTGTLSLNETVLTNALASGTAEFGRLFAGDTGIPGAFATLDTQLDAFTQGDGLIPGARKQMTEQATRLTDSIANMQDRLAIRRAALQREFIAADAAMSQLQSQTGSIASFGSSL